MHLKDKLLSQIRPLNIRTCNTLLHRNLKLKFHAHLLDSKERII